MPRVGDQQDDARAPVVALLQGESTRESLDVAEAGLGVHGQAPPSTLDDGVPRSAIARNRRRRLRPPTQVRRHQRAQLGQEGKLRGVADGLTGGVGAQWEVQPHDAGDQGEGHERDVLRLAKLDPTDLGRRQPDCISNSLLSEAGLQPSFTELVSDDPQ